METPQLIEIETSIIDVTRLESRFSFHVERNSCAYSPFSHMHRFCPRIATGISREEECCVDDVTKWGDFKRSMQKVKSFKKKKGATPQ